MSEHTILHQDDVEAVIEDVVTEVVQDVVDAHDQIVSTTTALADITAAINTTNKTVGKMVYNSTTGLPVFAFDATAGGLWKTAAGATAHTPV